MVNDVLPLRSHDFSELKKPRLDYAAQLSISPMLVNLAMTCFIHYGLHPGMLIRYLNGEYTGKSRDAEPICWEVSPHISNEDAAHIKWILTQGCPSNLVLEETPKYKLSVIQKGNQHTFLQHPEVTAKAIDKEGKNSHVLPIRYWTVYFSLWLRVTPQGGRHRVQLVRRVAQEPWVRGSNPSGARVQWIEGLRVAEPLVRGSNP